MEDRGKQQLYFITSLMPEDIKVQGPERSEDQLHEEALRATCSLCILEGHCVCGELDSIEENDSSESYHDDDQIDLLIDEGYD
jgi:hypothetical protein